MAPANAAVASGAGKAKSTARRSRSNQRRKVENELRSRKIHSKDVFALQQRMLAPGAGSALMDAARGLLQAKDYQAVVEERSLETLCGFPPCTHEAGGSGDVKKKWSTNSRSCNEFSAKDVGNFCSVECLRKSGAFELSLEPEPAYVRPASAVAASRGAVAEADATAEMKDQASASIEGGEQTSSGLPGKRPLPKVRQKAVVRFSRTNHTYTVHYDEYDGGGALPGVPSAHDPAAAGIKDSTSAKHSSNGIQGMLQAQVSERQVIDDAAALQTPGVFVDNGGSAASGQAQCSSEAGSVTELPGLSSSTTQATESVDDSEDVDNTASKKPTDDAGNHLGDQGGESEAEDDSRGFFDADGIDAAGRQLWHPESGFVRAWGVLTSWLTESARRTIHQGALPEIHPQDDRPDYATRRALLNEVLTERVPGELAALAPRLSEVVASLGIHQSLPTVSESNLYDLLGSLLLRVLLQAEVARGSCGASTATRGSELLTRKVKQAAQNLGMTAEELSALEALLEDQGSRGYVPVQSAA